MSHPWLSIVIPTLGQRRDGLLRTLESISAQACDGVEVMVVVDSYGTGDERGVVEVIENSILLFGPQALNYTFLGHDAGQHCYGQPQRTYGARQAKGDWVAFSQDDNILTAGALAAVAAAVHTAPRRQPLFFQVQTPWGEVVWRDRTLFLGNIDADCLVLPRRMAREITWGLRYEGDFDAALAAMQDASGDVGWCETQIAIARPTEADQWWS